MPRNILVSPDLELEMSGINERGIKAPPIRLPGKTHLADVLLTSNPWEQRDLERKLKELNRLQVQKERAHIWSQRRFFMNRIFDSDLSLRFGKLDVEKELREKSGDKSSGGRKKGKQGKSGKKKAVLKPEASQDKINEEKVYERPEGSKEKHGDENDPTDVDNNGTVGEDTEGLEEKPPLMRSQTFDSVKSNDKAPLKKPLPRIKSMNSLGIFATPLPENKRKYKIRSTTASVVSRRAMENNGEKSTIRPVVSPVQSEGGDDVGKTETHLNPPPVLEKSHTAPFILLRRATTGIDLQKDKGSVTGMTPDDPTCSSSVNGKLLKREVSFRRDAQITLNDDATQNDTHSVISNEKTSLMNGQSDENDDTASLQDRKSGKSGLEKQEESSGICDESVIVNLTRTLPTALMIKANANINAVINDRKHNMITASREISTRNTFSDERWRNLESLLVPQGRQPVQGLNYK